MTADSSTETNLEREELTAEELQLVLDAAAEGLKLEMAIKQLTSAYLDSASPGDDVNDIFQRMRGSRVQRALIERRKIISAMLLDLG